MEQLQLHTGIEIDSGPRIFGHFASLTKVQYDVHGNAAQVKPVSNFP